LIGRIFGTNCANFICIFSNRAGEPGSANPEDSVYFDATAGLHQGNENDSSGSHPIGDVNRNEIISAQGDTGMMVEGKFIVESNHSSGPIALNPTNTGLALGGCTPGLRRRRQASEKYATDPSQLGLRFQRRRRHHAGNFETEEEKICAPLADSENEGAGESERYDLDYLMYTI